MKTFWTSKIFWTAVLGFIAVLVNGLFNLEISNEIIVGIMSLLAIIFRWNTEQQLAVRKKK